MHTYTYIHTYIHRHTHIHTYTYIHTYNTYINVHHILRVEAKTKKKMSRFLPHRDAYQNNEREGGGSCYFCIHGELDGAPAP